MYFAIITNNKLNGIGQCPCNGDNTFSVEITKEIYDEIDKYTWDGEKLIINPDYDKILLENAKNTKIQDNDIARDEALNRGVVYKEILFDSDTDQKVNLLATVSMMSDTDTIEWFGMNNDSLICTKEDLLNIGGLITALHSFVWNKNAEIKEQIKEAETIEEVENIEVNYEN